MRYWLLKSEPSVFGFEDLQKRPHATEPWTGVRNYQARNFIRDQFAKGDRAFFYHSSCKEPGIVGMVEVVSTAYPDSTAFDPESPYFDPKSDPQRPRWYAVDVKSVRALRPMISLGST